MTVDEMRRLWDAAMKVRDEPQDARAAVEFGLSDEAKRFWGVTPEKAAKVEAFKASVRREARNG